MLQCQRPTVDDLGQIIFSHLLPWTDTVDTGNTALAPAVHWSDADILIMPPSPCMSMDAGLSSILYPQNLNYKCQTCIYDAGYIVQCKTFSSLKWFFLFIILEMSRLNIQKQHKKKEAV